MSARQMRRSPEPPKLLFLADGQDRARSAAQYFLGHVAFDEARQPAPAVSDHYDQVGRNFRRDLDDYLGGRAHLVEDFPFHIRQTLPSQFAPLVSVASLLAL